MAKISGIYVEIRGDATQLKKELASAREAVTQQAHGMSNALNNALSPAQLKNSINGLVKNLNQLSNASKLTGKDFAAIGADLGELQRLTGLSAAEFGKLQSKMMQTQAANAQEQALRGIAKAAGLTEREVQKLGARMGMTAGQIDKVTGASKKAKVEVQQTGNSMNWLGTVADTFLGVLGANTLESFTFQMVELSRSILEVGMNLESLEMSFKAIYEDADLAAEKMDKVRLTAKELGQNFYVVAPGFRQMAAAARETSLEGATIEKLFRGITAAATVLGMTTERTELTIKAFTDMISKGQIQMEEVKNQLGDNLPGAMQMFARAMGIGTDQFVKMAKEGQLFSDDVLPKVADELLRTYEKAAQTAALETGRAAVNRLSEEWTNLEANMYDSDSAVAGIRAITEAVEGLNAVVDGAKYISWGSFVASPSAAIVAAATAAAAKNRSSTNNSMRGSVDRNNIQSVTATGVWSALDQQSMKWSIGTSNRVASAQEEAIKAIQKSREALVKYIETEKERAKATYDAALAGARTEEERAKALAVYQETIARLDKKESAPGMKAAKASAKSYEQMIEDGKKAAEALDKYWNDYEDGRVKAVADGVAARETANAKDLALVTEFADKYKELILGETEFKRAQIEAQADAYRKAGADEIAVAQWAAQEKMAISRDWQDGAKRGLLDYADSATDAAQRAQDAITGGFKGMEDSLVEFVKTGKLSFSELADSIISDMIRIMVQQSITGPLASGMSSAISGWFSAGSSPSVASVGAPKVGYAKGGVPGAPSLSAYANTIVSKPTIFPFAKGVGLMGEAGPEAIMPLKRGPDGSLGVRAEGGSTSVVINNYSGAKAEAKETTDSRGNRRVEVVIGEMVAGEIQRQGSAANNSMRNSFGLRPTMARR